MSCLTFLGLSACLSAPAAAAPDAMPTLHCQTDTGATLYTVEADGYVRMKSPPSASGLVGLPPSHLPVTVTPAEIMIIFPGSGWMTINRATGAFTDGNTRRRVGTCGPARF